MKKAALISLLALYAVTHWLLQLYCALYCVANSHWFEVLYANYSNCTDDWMHWLAHLNDLGPM